MTTTYTKEFENFINPIDINEIQERIIPFDGLALSLTISKDNDGYFVECDEIGLGLSVFINVNGSINIENTGERERYIGLQILNIKGLTEAETDAFSEPNTLGSRLMEVATQMLQDHVYRSLHGNDITLKAAFESMHDQVTVTELGNDVYEFEFGGKKVERHSVTIRHELQLKDIWHQLENFIEANEDIVFSIKLAELGITKADLAHTLNYNPSSFYRLLNKKDAYIPSFVWLALDGLKYRQENK